MELNQNEIISISCNTIIVPEIIGGNVNGDFGLMTCH
jgi:hypothetical protein